MVASNSTSANHPASRNMKDANLDSDLVRQRLAELGPLLASVKEGDFSTNLTLPDQDDEFSELFVGVQTMQKVISELQELREQNQALQLKAIDHSRALEEAQALTHLGSWQWDIATDVITWSDELYRIYGMRPQERVIGFEEFIELIHPDDRQDVQGIITTSFQTGQPFEFEHRIILPNGDERILKGMGKMVVDKTGKPLRMLGTSQDVTQAKQLDRAKDEFISLVSHQLRTPLTIIRIHGHLLEDGAAGPLDAKQETHIRTMTSASIRLIELVDDILSISRVTLNRIRINAEPTDINQFIQACADEATPMAQTKQATITFAPDKSLGKVSVDTTIFGEVLRNLISNAIRYAKKRDGHIAIRFTKEANNYLLTVRDDGIGIPQLDQDYVFERFYRANNAIVVDSEGNGLGLYIVKLFTEAAGGKIWLESTEGKGTTFFVSLPFHNSPSPDPKP